MRSLTEPVISHWHKLVNGFAMSPLEFYAAVEAAMKARELPETTISRVEYHEGGIFSAVRVYLRIARPRHRVAFDICGAPFGRGFFFSSWLVQTKPLIRAWGCLVFIVAFFLAGMVLEKFGPSGCWIALLVALAGLWLLLLGIRADWFLTEDAVLAVPYLGPLYEYFFSPATYYRYDTALMFQELVHGALLEVIDTLLEGKGLRALSPEDRKPVTRSFV